MPTSVVVGLIGGAVVTGTGVGAFVVCECDVLRKSSAGSSSMMNVFCDPCDIGIGFDKFDVGGNGEYALDALVPYDGFAVLLLYLLSYIDGDGIGFGVDFKFGAAGTVPVEKCVPSFSLCCANGE